MDATMHVLLSLIGYLALCLTFIGAGIWLIVKGDTWDEDD